MANVLFTTFIQDQKGNALTGATYSVKDKSTGDPVTVFEDEAGTIADNGIAGALGRVEFYAPPETYLLNYSKDGFSNEVTIYVADAELVATQAAQVNSDASDVAADRAAVETLASDFSGTTVPAAVQAVTDEGASQVSAVGAAGTAQLGAVNAAGSTQVSAVETAGTAQAGLVNTEGSTQVSAVNTAGTTQVGLVQAEGATQVAAVQGEGATQIGTIQDSANAVLAANVYVYADYATALPLLGTVDNADVGDLVRLTRDERLSNPQATFNTVIAGPDLRVDEMASGVTYEPATKPAVALRASDDAPRHSVGGEAYDLADLIDHSRATGGSYYNASGKLVGMDLSTGAFTNTTDGARVDYSGGNAVLIGDIITATLAADAGNHRDIQLGQSYLVGNASNTANNAIATATAYDPSTHLVTLTVTAVNGTGAQSSPLRVSYLGLRAADYDPATGERRMLLEPAATNLLLSSDQVGNGDWLNTEGATANLNSARDSTGNTRMTEVIPAAGTAGAAAAMRKNVTKAASALAYSVRVECRQGDLAFQVLRVSGSGGSTPSYAFLEFATGNVTTEDNAATPIRFARAKQLGAGVWALEMGVTSNTEPLLRLASYGSPAASSADYTANGTDAYFVGRFDVYQASDTSSSITTLGAAATRAADVSAAVDLPIALNDATLALDFDLPEGSGTGTQILLSLTDGSSQVDLRIFATALRVAAQGVTAQIGNGALDGSGNRCRFVGTLQGDTIYGAFYVPATDTFNTNSATGAQATATAIKGTVGVMTSVAGSVRRAHIYPRAVTAADAEVMARHGWQ